MGGRQPGVEIWNPRTGVVNLILQRFGPETAVAGIADARIVTLKGKQITNSFINLAVKIVLPSVILTSLSRHETLVPYVKLALCLQ